MLLLYALGFLWVLAVSLVVATLGVWLVVAAPALRDPTVDSLVEPLRALRVPKFFWRGELIWFQYSLHGFVALSFLFGSRWWLVFASVVALILFGVYAVIIVQTYRLGLPCQCFHAGGFTSRRDLGRAGALLGASTVVLVGALVGVSPTRVAYLQLLGWKGLGVGVVAAAMVVGASMAPPRRGTELVGASVVPTSVGSSAPTFGSSAPASGGLRDGDVDGGEADYVSFPVPRVMVVGERGEVPLGSLIGDRPLLTFVLSPDCGSCLRVLDRLARYEQRLPEVEFVVLATREPERIRMSSSVPVYEDRNSVVFWLLSPATPSALLMAPNRMIVGGPVQGINDIEGFVEQIRTELDAVAN